MNTTDPEEGLSEPWDEREGEDRDRFSKALGSVAGHRVTYGELTGKLRAHQEI